MKILHFCKAIVCQCKGQARCLAVKQGEQGAKQRLGRCSPLIQEGPAPEPHQASSESSAAMHSTVSMASGPQMLY